MERRATKNDISVLCTLLSSAVKGEEPHLKVQPDDWRSVYELAWRQSVANTAYFGVRRLSPSDRPEEEIVAHFEQSFLLAVKKDVFRRAELADIMQEFSAHRIAYCLLKGSVIRGYYPTPEMRTMVDVDILVRKEELSAAGKLLSGLGYTFDGETEHHETYTSKQGVHVELHNMLFEGGDSYAEYYRNVFSRLKKADDEYRYSMSECDLYIYQMAHSASHFKTSSVGIRSVMDSYVMLRYGGLDDKREYILSEFAKLGILQFASQMEKLGAVLFDGEQCDEQLWLFAENILCGSVFGTERDVMLRELLDADEKGTAVSKSRYLLGRVFATKDYMLKQYPILQKYGFLLPVYYVYRVLHAVYTKPKMIFIEWRKLRKINRQHIERARRAREQSGLYKDGR